MCLIHIRERFSRPGFRLLISFPHRNSLVTEAASIVGRHSTESLMPYYSPLRKLAVDDRRRTIKGIQALRKQKRVSVPGCTLNDTLLLATWNIRDFGNEDKRAANGLKYQTSGAFQQESRQCVH